MKNKIRILTGALLGLSALTPNLTHAETPKIKEDITQECSGISQKLNNILKIVDPTLVSRLNTHPTHSPHTNSIQITKGAPDYTAAAFNRKTDKILIKSCPNTAELEAVIHELVHSIWDEEGEKGVMESNQYNGPTKESIAQYVKAKTSSPSFDKIKEKLTGTESDIQTILNLLESLLTELSQTKEKIILLEKIKPDIQLGITNDEINYSLPLPTGEKLKIQSEVDAEFDKKIEELKTEFSSIAKIFLSIRERSKSLVTQFLNDTSSVNRSTTSSILDKIKSLEESHSKLIPTLEPNFQKNIFVSIGGHKLREAFLQKVQFFSPEELQQHNSSIQEATYLENIFPADIEDLKKRAILEPRSLLTRANQIIISQAKERVFSPEECFARIVHSLYVIHLGPTEMNLWPLTHKDLDWLETFVLKDGTKMFEVGIARYRLALEMQADGMNIQEIQKQLKSEQVTYKGKNFFFPHTDIN